MGFFKKVGKAIGNTVGNLVNPAGQQHKYNKQLAAYTFDKNLEMWNLQNEYNAPKNQMARFKEAGLNPNLIYGQGSPGNAQQAPKYQQEGVDQSKNPLVSAQIAMAGAEIRKTQAETDEIKQNTKQSEQRTVSLAIENAFQKWFTGYNFDGKGTHIPEQSERGWQEMYRTYTSEEGLNILRKQLKGLEYDNTFKAFVAKYAEKGVNVHKDDIMTRALFDIASKRGWLEDDTMVMLLYSQLMLSGIFSKIKAR
jgi:hypothetical protein